MRYWDNHLIYRPVSKIDMVLILNAGERPMRYLVKLLKTEEGYAVWCPALRGCCSQGETEAEALENIKTAIREYLEVVEELNQEGKSHYVDLEIGVA